MRKANATMAKDVFSKPDVLFARIKYSTRVRHLTVTGLRERSHCSQNLLPNQRKKKEFSSWH
jgi:hypothetical protein